MTRRRQHFKGRKRLKSWHRGRSEAERWARLTLPDLGTDADPSAGKPAPLRRMGGRGNRGEAI